MYLKLLMQLSYKFILYQLVFSWLVVYYILCIFVGVSFLRTLLYILLIILASTYISLVERHIVAVVQQRVGPSATFLGLLQPLADAFKLLTKEPTRPYQSHLYLFRGAPLYTVVVAILAWAVLPLGDFTNYVQFEYSLLFILAVLTLNNYGIIFGAWASQNKYALLSGYRTIALTSSYGITLTLIFWYPATLAQSYNLQNIVEAQDALCWFIWPGLPIAILFLIVVLTEVKKIPFDVTESEAELGSGYLVEYSGMAFALFVISEYCYILIFLLLFIQCFLGGWLAPGLLGLILPKTVIYFIKIAACLMSYLLIRASLPNYRFDFIMSLHWRCLFPLALIGTVVSALTCLTI